MKVRVVKNKVAPPFRLAEFDIMFSEGISKEGGLLDVGIEMGLARKTGSFFSFGDQRLGQGRENAKEFLRAHPDMAIELERQIRERALAARAPVAVGDPVNGAGGDADPNDLL